MTNDAKIWVRLPSPLKKQLERHAKKEGVDVSLIVRKAVRDFLDQQKKH